MFCSGSLMQLLHQGMPRRSKDSAYWRSNCACLEWNAKDAMGMIASVFERYVTTRTDPFHFSLFRHVEDVPQHDAPHSSRADRCFITLLVFESNEPSERNVIAWKHFSLEEGKAELMCSHQLGLVIGGPAGSGKSTLVASLMDEMQNLASSLATRINWLGFNLPIRRINLDIATPTVDAIAAGKGKERGVLGDVKRQWGKGLAIEAVNRFAEAKRNGITIADLPGGTVDTILAKALLFDLLPSFIEGQYRRAEKL